ncbi:hypothetical protein INT43_004853 [Umbelopsis isabellina]|uniref:NDT80 domain-containing protein n=1 Tax=Mortierella isabellina TaxID=91625 RepID=A0A8H7U6X5_MORIS|nr:hypothetical protein INT43_004853 [Umbelopsis isabellina]
MSVQDKEWPVENNSLPAQQDDRQYHPSMRPQANSYMHPYVQDHPHAISSHGYNHPSEHGSYMSPVPQEHIDSARQHPGSQPSTPRPGSPIQHGAHSLPQSPNQEQRKESLQYPPQYPPNSPYAIGPVRKRRNDSIYQSETGPFFTPTKTYGNLFATDRSSILTPRLSSKIDRGFFLADNDWTCYRRNYFQVSSVFAIDGLSHIYNDHELPCLVQINDNFYPVKHFNVGISAKVSNSDKVIDLIQHTPKRDKGPQMTPPCRPLKPGGDLRLSSVGSGLNIITYERVQFKTATANNGKRRAAQQYYVIVVDLYACVANNEQVRVASSHSAPLVVRGRSPGHYADGVDRYNPMMVSPPAMDEEASRGAHYGRDHPMPSPGGMQPPTGDYASAPYSYPNYHPYPPQPYSPMMINSPTGPSSHYPPPAHPQYGPPQHPYIVPSISDPSSSESSSPDLYSGEFAEGGENGQHKLAQVHHSPYHPPHTSQLPPPHGINMHGGPHEHENWQRSRGMTNGYPQPASPHEVHHPTAHHPEPYYGGGPPHLPSPSTSGPSAFTPTRADTKLDLGPAPNLPSIHQSHPLTPTYPGHGYSDFQWQGHPGQQHAPYHHENDQYQRPDDNRRAEYVNTNEEQVEPGKTKYEETNGEESPRPADKKSNMPERPAELGKNVMHMRMGRMEEANNL